MAAFIRRFARRGDYYAPNSAGIAKLLRTDAKAATTDSEVWHVKDQVKTFAAARTITAAQAMSVYKILAPKMGLEPGAFRRGAKQRGSLSAAFHGVALGLGATGGFGAAGGFGAYGHQHPPEYLARVGYPFAPHFVRHDAKYNEDVWTVKGADGRTWGSFGTREEAAVMAQSDNKMLESGVRMPLMENPAYNFTGLGGFGAADHIHARAATDAAQLLRNTIKEADAWLAQANAIESGRWHREAGQWTPTANHLQLHRDGLSIFGWLTHATGVLRAELDGISDKDATIAPLYDTLKIGRTKADRVQRTLALIARAHR